VMYTEWAAAALKLLVWGALVAADVDLPPPKYDHPYRGPVQYVYDFRSSMTGTFSGATRCRHVAKAVRA
jgi:hypothetical protein